MAPFDPAALRRHFPALAQQVAGRPVVFLDGPGGTQVPQRVIDAVGRYLAHDNANYGGAFGTSERTVETVTAARQALADLFNARRPEEIAFGQNMTSLTFALSRALSRTWRPGDEIVLTRLDHDANISPWLLAAEDRGVTVRWLDFRPEDGTLKLEELPGLLTDRTRLVALTAASNGIGTLVDVARAAEMAHAAGALLFVDAVHFAPHGLIDVQALDCDFLVVSAYKFYGPHNGALYGKYELLDDLDAYKVRPAPDLPPGKWETGTQGFESLAGVTAAVDYLAEIGGQAPGGPSGRRASLVRAMEAISQYERQLSHRFLEQVARVPGVRVYGLTDVERLDERVPTFALSIAGHPAREAAELLGRQGLFVWDGHYYALEVMDRLGVLKSGGLVRIGFVHYNTFEEVDRTVAALAQLSR
jgi:cysteine desulfurase family protein (TIGR01976 family)